MAQKPIEEVVKQLKSEGLNYVQFLFSDITGQLRCMEENIDLLPKFSKSGVGVDGSSIPGLAQVNNSDVRLMPDMETFAVYTFGTTRIARVLCNVLFQGKPHPGCIRSAFLNVLHKCNEMGFEASQFGELEWYFLNQDGTPHDEATYCSMPPEDKGLEIRHELGDRLEEAGCRVKRIHHENGPGQNEVELKLTPAKKNSDDLVTAMSLIRMVGHKHNLKTIFLPKPLADLAGNGYHQHNALYDIKTHVNVFGGKTAGEISEIGRQFTAGMIEHAPEITAIFARHEGSFERLKPGHEAPGVACWGSNNRTALIRIPDITDVQDTRIEYRGGDASGSTYMLCAAILAAGLDGIERKLECPEQQRVNVDALTDAELAQRGLKRLPSCREQTQKILKESAWLQKTFGSHIMDYLINH
eukprot:m51a1_g2699 hypothetical protein (413) ;mRNA; r:797481-799172